MLHEGLLCLHSLLALLVDHILFIDLEVRVITSLGEIPGLRLAMLDNQMAGEPNTSVEPEAWMEIFHLLIVSECRRTDKIGHTFLTMRPYSAGQSARLLLKVFKISKYWSHR